MPPQAALSLSLGRGRWEGCLVGAELLPQTARSLSLGAEELLLGFEVVFLAKPTLFPYPTLLGLSFRLLSLLD